MKNTLNAHIVNEAGTLTLCIRNGENHCLVKAELELVDTGKGNTGSRWTAEVLAVAGFRGIDVAGRVLQVKNVIGGCDLAAALREGTRFVQSTVMALYAGRLNGKKLPKVHFRTPEGKLITASNGTQGYTLIHSKSIR